MMAAQDLKTRVFDFINLWGPILTSIVWAIRAAHHSTLGYMPAQHGVQFENNHKLERYF